MSSQTASTQSLKEVVIVSAARTPVGSFGGVLKDVPAVQLGATAIKGAVARAGIDPELVDEVIMGCVLPAALGQAPARQAAIFAGLPKKVECMTINKVCGSGLKAVMLAAQAIMVGDADVIVAGGMENMDAAPYALPKGRYGHRMGNATMLDCMVNDGLWDPYNNNHMGVFAEKCAREEGYSREAQDAFAIESYTRSQKAVAEGLLADEIVPVEIKGRKGTVTIDTDEEPGRGNFEKLPKLRPAFDKEGTVTAANASSINDGAAALVVMSADKAAELGLTPMVRIVGQASYAHEPEWFTTAPKFAVDKLLKKTNREAKDIALWEVNEAFAVVTMYANEKLNLDPAIVNVHGGAVSIGHPIGASGARILVTLLYAMQRYEKTSGIATLCIGGGEAAALLVEKM
jgi:acetyl-CoA C-acetyltransferase